MTHVVLYLHTRLERQIWSENSTSEPNNTNYLTFNTCLEPDDIKFDYYVKMGKKTFFYEANKLFI